jgi:outer membrane lipoprotein-sorting protein
MKIITLILFLSFHGYAKNFIPTSFSSQYEESLKSITGKVKKSFGKIDYQYPGLLRFEVTSPSPSLVIVNNVKTWFYRPAFVKGEQNEVTIEKSKNLPMVKLLDSLKDGFEKSQVFDVKYSGKDIHLEFRKNSQQDFSIQRVILHTLKNAHEVTSLKEVEAITLVNKNKSETKIKFFDLRENPSFLKNHFEYSPQPNTKVIDNAN